MPDRRVGKQRQFYAVYGSSHPTEVLLVTLQNARPRGQWGITRRAKHLIPGRIRVVSEGFIQIQLALSSTGLGFKQRA